MASAEQSPPEGLVNPVRPSLVVLQQDQRSLIKGEDDGRYPDAHHLRGGFPDRRAVIRWFQRASVRTFGHLGGRFPLDAQLQHGGLLSCLITGPDRQRWYDEPLSLRKARLVRERYESRVLLPACNAAYNELREVAGEYIEDGDGPAWHDLDPEGQKHVAMRPGFQRLDVEQSRALADLWGGFEHREALFDWLHTLDDASNGAIRPDLAAQVARSAEGTRRMLSGHPEPGKARRTREEFAIKVLLPAFAEGVRSMSAGELAARERSKLTPIEG